MITKNSVLKIQNLVVNHESRPVKSNPIVKRLSTRPPQIRPLFLSGL